MQWWQVCAVIFSVGTSGLIMIGGIVFIVNRTGCNHYIENITARKDIELQIKREERLMLDARLEHERKLLSS